MSLCARETFDMRKVLFIIIWSLSYRPCALVRCHSRVFRDLFALLMFSASSLAISFKFFCCFFLLSPFPSDVLVFFSSFCWINLFLSCFRITKWLGCFTIFTKLRQPPHTQMYLFIRSKQTARQCTVATITGPIFYLGPEKTIEKDKQTNLCIYWNVCPHCAMNDAKGIVAEHSNAR